MNQSNYLNHINSTNTSNLTSVGFDDLLDIFLDFERYVRIIIPIAFGLIFVLGLLGNTLVIVAIISNQRMRTTTNVFILNLAFADLFFIVFCVPSTALSYVLTIWPFGEIWCKIVNYLIYVFAYASVYTLVVMTIDRFLALVHPITTIAIRTQTNAVRIVIILWIVILAGHIQLLFESQVLSYIFNGESRSTCVNINEITNNGKMKKLFYGTFFVLGYALPLSVICVLNACILRKLLYGFVPNDTQSAAASLRSKTRASKLVVIVVATFAFCWLPIQVVFMIQHFGYFVPDTSILKIQFAANCLAYLNSCVNPILYTFLSNKFRKCFRKLLCGKCQK